MTKPNGNPNSRATARPFHRWIPTALLSLALIAGALLTAPVAGAQDPGIDQYSPQPTQPGNDNSSDGNLSPVPAAGSDSGGPPGGDRAGDPDPAVAPTGDSEEGGSSGGVARKPRGNADERTLDGFAASAEQQRVERGAGAQPLAQLSDDGGDGGSAGIGVLVWIALAAIVLWAVGAGVVNYRRRRGAAAGESSHQSGEQQLA